MVIIVECNHASFLHFLILISLMYINVSLHPIINVHVHSPAVAVLEMVFTVIFLLGSLFDLTASINAENPSYIPALPRKCTIQAAVIKYMQHVDALQYTHVIITLDVQMFNGLCTLYALQEMLRKAGQQLPETVIFQRKIGCLRWDSNP